MINSKNHWYGTWPGAEYNTQWWQIFWGWLHIHILWIWGKHIQRTNFQDKNIRGGSIEMLSVPSIKNLTHPIKGKHHQPQYWHTTTKHSGCTTIKKFHILCPIQSNGSKPRKKNYLRTLPTTGNHKQCLWIIKNWTNHHMPSCISRFPENPREIIS